MTKPLHFIPLFIPFILLNKIISKIPMPIPPQPKHDVQVVPAHLVKETSPANPLIAPAAV